MIASPAEIACDELLATLNPTPLEVCTVDDESQLRQLWRIDVAAYGDHSLAYDGFLDWWQRYPAGSRCLTLDGQIIASIGIYPLTKSQAEEFSIGHIQEDQLIPFCLKDCELHGSDHWYFSGLVIVPEFQNRGIVRRLIRSGVGEWMRSGHLRYPISLYGLGQTEKGRKALELCGMRLLVPGSLLPDQLDLYGTTATNAPELRAHFLGW